MSPENDLLFAHSDFGNLTEFDNFPKDLFLSNAIEEIPDGGLLGDLDCKDDLKPLLICEVDDAFGDSLKVGEDDDPNSVKGRCSPFTMFIDEESSEPLGFMNMPPKLDTPNISDGAEMQSMGLSSAIKHTPHSGSSEQGVLPSHSALLAASELDCMSLDELDLTHANTTNALCTMSPRSSLQATSTMIQGNRAEPAASVAPLSPIGKASMNGNLLRREALSLSSADMAASSILQINSPITSPSSTTTFRSSDGVPLFNMMLRGETPSSIHCLKGSTPQPATVLGVEAIRSAFGVPNVMQPPSPSMQRSQSSHALGQLRLSGRVGPCNDEFNVLPSCKQEVPLSSASSVSFYTPYQAANTQGFTGSSPAAPIRRVYSTGDLQAFHEAVQNFYGGNPDNVIAEEAAGVKIGHYTMEERKMKLHRYRQKRTERNFSKKIKYACRKTLADSRPRVRGRFARTDEMGDSSLRGSDLPLIDEYEEVTSHRPRMIPDQHAYLMANNSCIMSSNPIAQFWNTVGMKVAM